MLEGPTLAAKRNSKSRPGSGWVGSGCAVVGLWEKQTYSWARCVCWSVLAGRQVARAVETCGLWVCGKGAEIEEYWDCCLKQSDTELVCEKLRPADEAAEAGSSTREQTNSWECSCAMSMSREHGLRLRSWRARSFVREHVRGLVV